MKFLISLHLIRTGRIGGVENAAYNLCQGLAENGCELVLGVRSCADIDPAFLELMSAFPKVAVEPSPPGVARAGRVACEEAFFLKSRSRGGLYLAVNYRLPFLASLFRRRRIGVIVHDLLPLARPQDVTLRKRLFFRLEVARAARRADLMVFISAYSRDDFTRIVGPATRGHAVVAPNAVDWESLGPAAGDTGLDGVILLSVANDYPHKNLAVMYDGFLEARRTRPELRLIFVGRPAAHFGTVADVGFLDRLPSVARFEDLPAALRQDPAVRISGLSRSELGRLYGRADLVVHPSLHEGFGLPVVEAGGFGAAILTTSLTAIPEVAPPHTRYVSDPLEPQAWAEAIGAAIARGSTPPDAASIAEYRGCYAPAAVVRPLLAAAGLS